MSESDYDIAIIGGGIVGLATAMALSEKKSCSIIVLEAESKIAAHQSSHNSGVIHSGLYYKPGSLKAKNCVSGREALYQFCQQHNIPHENCGKVIVATNDSEIPALEKLLQRSKENGMTGVRRIDLDELREREPHCKGTAALHVAETGIINYRLIAEKYAEIIQQAGHSVQTNSKVVSVEHHDQKMVLQTTDGPVRSRFLINCGGLNADRVASMCGVKPGLKIIPFRGEYYELAAGRESLVNNLIYPVPDPRFPFLGVHFTRMIDGGVEAGPNAVLALARHGYRWSNISLKDLSGMAFYSGFWKMAANHWKVGFGEMYRSLSKNAFVKALQKLLPELQASDIVSAGSGVRAQAVTPDGKLVDDFRIVGVEKMIHVLNAPSPAATSSISIGKNIAQIAENDFEL